MLGAKGTREHIRDCISVLKKYIMSTHFRVATKLAFEEQEETYLAFVLESICAGTIQRDLRIIFSPVFSHL